jgi:sulfhydrogenase subunit beta (sulfur reductase)
MTQIISRQDLLSWLERLIGERIVIAPARSNGLVLFQRVSRAEDIVLDFDNTVLSPKESFLPLSEVLFTVDKENGNIKLMPATVDEEMVLFGLRPCDAKGMAVIDEPLLAAPADGLYQQHRAKTTLIGLACSQAGPECFCTSMGTAPDDPSNLDIMLTRVNDSYIVQATTEKGKALLPSDLIAQSEVTPPPPPSPQAVPTEGIVEVMRGVFESPYWSRLADRCLHCNLCAYVCPTCYCFDIRDYIDEGGIERVRSWESCQSRGFTRLAGGYDPRPTKGARLRQRFYHKLSYFPEHFGLIGCVGCGRCVRYCPVNIDIREVISDIQKLGAQSEC